MPPTKKIRYDRKPSKRKEADHKQKNDQKERRTNDAPPPKRARASEAETQPPMMTFKGFLSSQDDSISDEEASVKYAEYKLEFRRQQLKEFYMAHKEDDWFRVKYHPADSVARKGELKEAVHRRAQVFMDMMNSGCFEGVPLESEKGETIEKLLDSFVMRLETLEETSKEEPKLDSDDDSNPREQEVEETKSRRRSELESSEKDYEWIIIDDIGGEDDEDDVTIKHDKMNDALLYSEDPTDEVEKEKENTDSGDDCTNHHEHEAQSNLTSLESKENLNEAETTQPTAMDSGEKQSNDRNLHKTRSIFLRNISSKVSKSEIAEACKEYPGYLRVWLSDAQPDQHWCRRGFVTFKRDVNIKQICWNLNSLKLKGSEWQAVVNHDLVKRIRSANILANHKQVVMADLKLATRIIQELDRKAGLWNQDTSQEDTMFTNTGNPLFFGIMDYLVEEAPAEAEELLGKSAVLDEYNAQTADKLKVLDKLLLYLRMVHSVDYYNGSQYVHEDEMPNRCGIIHLRGPISPNEVNSEEVENYIESHSEKLKPLFTVGESLTQATLLSLGYKEKEAEIEKFIQTNTQELAPDKFLCPLSGKKFKAPEFVRKHIINKFFRELDVIRHEVEYFNNYVLDPKRPELPEHQPGFGGKKEFEQQPYPYHFSGGGFRRGFPFGHFGGHGFFMRGRGMPPPRGRGDFRPIVTYRDLDAPNEPEEMV